MLVIVLLFLILVIAFFLFQLFLLKPSYRRMFKKIGNKNRVSISYATLFDVDSVAKLVQKKLLKSKDTPLYIKAYSVRCDFEQTQTLDQIKQTILDFQTQLRNEVNFNTMYLKDCYDILIEIWIKYSNRYSYRRKCIKRLCYLYKSRQVGFRFLCKLFQIVCGF